MKTLTILAFTLLTGCATMTPAQKKWTGVAVGVLVVGAVAAHRADHGDGPAPPVGKPPGCAPQPDGSCR